MINIFEAPAKKSVSKTSLFIQFEFNQKVIDTIKLADNYNYDKNTKLWELPLSKLSFLIDELTYIDDIHLSLLADEIKDELDLTIKYKTNPFNHQKEAIKWLINHNNGLLLDAPGLGKTLETIYAAEELHKQKGFTHCLIICGINSLKANWKKEIAQHSTLSCRVIGEKINSKGTTTYSSIKERADELYNEFDEFFSVINLESLRDITVIDSIKNSKNKFDIIVCDEVHKIKNVTSQQGKNFLKLKDVGAYHWGLTGTVLVNSPLDSYAALKFIGEEKGTYSNFKQFYCVIENKFGHQNIVGYKNIDLLKNEINNCSLRRTKDLLNLPSKNIIPEYIDLQQDQFKFYKDIQSGAVAEADRVNIKTTSLLGLVTRLRQAATCPNVLSTTQFSNTKLERAVDLVEEIVSNGEKVVIFSTFKDPLYELNDRLRKYKPLLCTGDQDDQFVSEAVTKFQNKDDNSVFIGTIQKVATGLTLNRATYMILLDSPWTYSEFEQCTDRIHRVTNTKPVFIYDLIAKDTIDERIYNIVNRKKGISDFIIDNNYNQTTELKELLGIKNYFE